MARGKVRLQWIINAGTRRSTLRKRGANLIKKVRELSILCGVPACLIVYGPGETQPEVWPSVAEATELLQRFKDMPESEQDKNMLDRVGLLQQKIDKANAKLYTARRDNREREVNLMIHDFIAGRRQSFDDVSPELSRALQWVVDTRLQAVTQRIETLRGEAMAPPPPPPPPQEEPLMVEPLAQVPMMVPNAAAVVGVNEPLAMDTEPRHGSYLKEVLDACDVHGDGSGVPTTEELEEVYRMAGLAWPPSNPSFKPM